MAMVCTIRTYDCVVCRVAHKETGDVCLVQKSVGNTPPVETERSFFVIKKQYVNAQKPRKVNWGKLGLHLYHMYMVKLSYNNETATI